MTNEQIEATTVFERERVMALADKSDFGENIWNVYQFVSWARWNPDLFVELFRGQESNFKLHFDQRVFMRADLRFISMYGVFSRGYAKCITGDSLVFTEDGIKEIGYFFDYQNDGIETQHDMAVNVVNRYGKMEKTRLGIYNGKQECLSITTDDGYSLTGTKVHKVLVMNKKGNIEFVNTSDISIGDYVLINRNNNVWGSDNIEEVSIGLKEYLDNCSKQQKSHLNIRELPAVLNRDLGTLLGYLIGDGCLTLDSSVIFSNCGDSVLDKYKELSSKYFKIDNIIKQNDYDYRINDKYLRKYLELLGFGFEKAREKHIPPLVLSSSRDTLIGVIQGLFDTDGTVDDKVISHTTVSEKLAKQVQTILLNLGIISRIKKSKTNGGLGYCFKNIISGDDTSLFNDIVGFGLKHKQEKLEILANKNHNINKNVIPYQREKLSEIIEPLNLSKKDLKEFYHILNSNNNMTYLKLNKLLSLLPNDCEGYSYLKELQEMNYYYSKVTSIEECVSDVYDFNLPETHSFVSNGLISHNTFSEILDDFIAAILYPGITLSVTAQTKENAAKLLEEKYKEIIKFFPLMKYEIQKARFSKNDAEIIFNNGSEITNLANAQSSKGLRRHRLKIEESVLLNNALYEDALEPIVEVPRTTVGKFGIVDPEEMNNQIHFFTTSGFRGSDEYNRSVNMVEGMRNLSGEIVLGSSWMLPCYYGRGSTKARILKKKQKSNPIFFSQNYEQKWVGCSDGALVDINKLMALRSLDRPIWEIEDDKEEYYIGVDVARSEKTSNNQSAIVVAKVIRNPKTKRITEIQIVNVLGVPNTMNFTDQATYIKRLKKSYDAKMVIIDGNGLGSGLVDKLLETSYDPLTGEDLGCFDTINTDNKPQSKKAEKCLYDMKAQGKQTAVVSRFIDAVDSGMLKMLERKQEQEFTPEEREFFDRNVLPYVNTELLFLEISNLKLKVLSKNNLTVEKVVGKIDKDKFSALSYVIFYIMEFCNKDIKHVQNDSSIFKFRRPNIYGR